MVSVFLNFDVLLATDDRNWHFFMTESSSLLAFKLNFYEFEERCDIVPFIDVSQGLQYMMQELSYAFALIGPPISKETFAILPHCVIYL